MKYPITQLNNLNPLCDKILQIQYIFFIIYYGKFEGGITT